MWSLGIRSKLVAHQDKLRPDGSIAWPTLLRNEAYRGLVLSVETAWGRCSTNTSGDRGQFAQIFRDFLEELKSHAAEWTPAEYVAVKQFLKTLLREAESPAK